VKVDDFELFVNNAYDITEDESKLRPSMGGSCIKKQKFRSLGAPKDEMPITSLRRMKIGTLIHSDIAKSMKYIKGTSNIVYTELPIQIKSLDIEGTCDGLILVLKDYYVKDCILYDIKTIPMYQYSKMFGRKKDLKPSIKYEVQLGTYGIGIEETYGIKVNQMFLFYVNINDGRRKAVLVDEKYKELAREYWLEVKGAMDKKIQDFKRGDLNTPVENWECRYCRYESICDNPTEEGNHKKTI
jgi:CRISPR/Cas system-associated exonuclease Cas4 (RecB family)